MALSDIQTKLVRRHLKKNIANSLCRMCGKSELKVHPELTGTPLTELKNGNLKIYAREIIPLVQVVCPTCYHTEHFLAEGILGKIKK